MRDNGRPVGTCTKCGRTDYSEKFIKGVLCMECSQAYECVDCGAVATYHNPTTDETFCRRCNFTRAIEWCATCEDLEPVVREKYAELLAKLRGTS